MSQKFPVLSIPASAGIGLRSPHVTQMLRERPSVGWLEVHAENYMGNSSRTEALAELRSAYALSIHGVGLSLGGMTGIDRDHLARLSQVCERFEPALVSEHLAWSSSQGAYLNDLLPLRYDEAALAIVAANIDLAQEKLKRPILVENLAAYLALSGSTMSEATFLSELVRRTGCGLLLDINNVHVSAHNLGFNAWEFIDELPVSAIGEIHLAGHAENEFGDETILIDDHGSRVPACVWALYARTIEKTGARPTLIEWDSALPELPVLLGEAMWADLLAGSIVHCGARTKLAGRQTVPARVRERQAFPGTGLMMPALAAHVAAGHFASRDLSNGRKNHAFA